MPSGRVVMLSWGLCLVMALPATVATDVLRLLVRSGVNGYLMGAAIVAALVLLACWPFWCRYLLQNVMRSEKPEMERFRAALLEAPRRSPQAKSIV